MVKANKRILIITALSVALGFVVGYFWMSGEMNRFKIAYLGEYCRNLKERKISMEEVRAEIRAGIIENPGTEGEALFTTSNFPFSPLCRVEYDLGSGMVKAAYFIRD